MRSSEAGPTATQPRRRRLVPTPNGGNGVTSWLVCRAGPHLHAIPLEHVIESMRVLPIDAISGAPRYVLGLCIIRGSPVPVVDPGLLLNDQLLGDQRIRSQRLVTIRAGRRTIALAVEEVLGIRAIGAETFSQLPSLLRDAAAETIAAIGILDAELLFFLHTARMVPEDLLDRFEADGSLS
jgi:purine-binding chemotaxis protein CheW